MSAGLASPSNRAALDESLRLTQENFSAQLRKTKNLQKLLEAEKIRSNNLQEKLTVEIAKNERLHDEMEFQRQNWELRVKESVRRVENEMKQEKDKELSEKEVEWKREMRREVEEEKRRERELWVAEREKEEQKRAAELVDRERERTNELRREWAAKEREYERRHSELDQRYRQLEDAKVKCEGELDQLDRIKTQLTAKEFALDTLRNRSIHLFWRYRQYKTLLKYVVVNKWVQDYKFQQLFRQLLRKSLEVMDKVKKEIGEQIKEKEGIHNNGNQGGNMGPGGLADSAGNSALSAAMYQIHHFLKDLTVWRNDANRLADRSMAKKNGGGGGYSSASGVSAASKRLSFADPSFSPPPAPVPLSSQCYDILCSVHEAQYLFEQSLLLVGETGHANEREMNSFLERNAQLTNHSIEIEDLLKEYKGKYRELKFAYRSQGEKLSLLEQQFSIVLNKLRKLQQANAAAAHSTWRSTGSSIAPNNGGDANLSVGNSPMHRGADPSRSRMFISLDSPGRGGGGFMSAPATSRNSALARPRTAMELSRSGNQSHSNPSESPSGRRSGLDEIAESDSQVTFAPDVENNEGKTQQSAEASEEQSETTASRPSHPFRRHVRTKSSLAFEKMQQTDEQMKAQLGEIRQLVNARMEEAANQVEHQNSEAIEFAKHADNLKAEEAQSPIDEAGEGELIPPPVKRNEAEKERERVAIDEHSVGTASGTSSAAHSRVWSIDIDPHDLRSLRSPTKPARSTPSSRPATSNAHSHSHAHSQRPKSRQQLEEEQRAAERALFRSSDNISSLDQLNLFEDSLDLARENRIIQAQQNRKQQRLRFEQFLQSQEEFLKKKREREKMAAAQRRSAEEFALAEEKESQQHLSSVFHSPPPPSSARVRGDPTASHPRSQSPARSRRNQTVKIAHMKAAYGQSLLSDYMVRKDSASTTSRREKRSNSRPRSPESRPHTAAAPADSDPASSEHSGSSSSVRLPPARPQTSGGSRSRSQTRHRGDEDF